MTTAKELKDFIALDSAVAEDGLFKKLGAAVKGAISGAKAGFAGGGSSSAPSEGDGKATGKGKYGLQHPDGTPCDAKKPESCPIMRKQLAEQEEAGKKEEPSASGAAAEEEKKADKADDLSKESPSAESKKDDNWGGKFPVPHPKDFYKWSDPKKHKELEEAESKKEEDKPITIKKVDKPAEEAKEDKPITLKKVDKHTEQPKWVDEYANDIGTKPDKDISASVTEAWQSGGHHKESAFATKLNDKWVVGIASTDKDVVNEFGEGLGELGFNKLDKFEAGLYGSTLFLCDPKKGYGLTSEERDAAEPSIPVSKPSEESLTDLTAKWDTAAKVCTERNQALRKAIADGAGKDEIARLQKDVHDANTALSKIGEKIDAHHKKSLDDSKKDGLSGDMPKWLDEHLQDIGTKPDKEVSKSVTEAWQVGGHKEKAWATPAKDKWVVGIQSADKDVVNEFGEGLKELGFEKLDQVSSKAYGSTLFFCNPKKGYGLTKEERGKGDAKKYIDGLKPSSGKKTPSPEAQKVREAFSGVADPLNSKKQEAITNYLAKEGFAPTKSKTYLEEYDHDYYASYYDACFKLDSEADVPRLKKAFNKMMKASGIAWGLEDDPDGRDAIDIRQRKHVHKDGSNYRARVWFDADMTDE